MRRVIFALFGLILGVAPVLAQDRATLLADSVTVRSGSSLLASGHVEVFFKGQHMSASSVLYDQSSERLVIEGPIRIDTADGSLFLADQADLSSDLSEGLLQSARLVLNRQLQLAASQIQRTDGGRVTALRNVVTSSCTICKGSATPLWEIRASEVVHDAASRQIYFSDASLRFYGVPVLYLPVLRVPDPSLSRATGFLLPKLRSTTALGLGLKVPYFITLGESRDLTVTPYFTVLGNKTVELRYREAFRTGSINFDGSLSRDDLGSSNPRGYLTGNGSFDLGRDFNLDFYGTSVSDRAYLLDYGISNADRLRNQIILTRFKRDLNFSARLIGLQSLRAGDTNRTLPSSLTDVTYERRFAPVALGGTAGFKFQIHGEYRRSTDPLDTNGDGAADGRDMGRIGLALDWSRGVTTSNGIVVTAMTTASLDSYSVYQDSVYQGAPQRASGTVGVELRWPWIRPGKNGVSQVIEPVAQWVTTARSDASIPNSDSTLAELDEGNLFALDRFPGADAIETGARLNLGVNFRRNDPEGWSLGATAGRVLRLNGDTQFSAASGLDGAHSDWLVAWSLNNAEGLGLTNRLIIADDLSLTKGELRFDYVRPKTTLSGGYEYLLADATENRTDTASEVVLSARHDITGNWTANWNGRYDLRSERVAQSGLELDFRNECLDVTLSLSRRYTSSTSVKPSTDIGLSVELLGFGGGSASGPSRVCGR